MLSNDFRSITAAIKLEKSLGSPTEILATSFFEVFTNYLIKAEVIELQAGNHSKITKKPLNKLRLPDGCVIGGVLHAGKVEIATGITHIDAGDRVMVFCLPEAVDKVSQLFQ